PFTDYEKSKIEMTKMVNSYVKKGIDVCIVSPTRVFGSPSNSVSNSVTLLIKNYVNGSWKFIPGDGSKVGNYAFIDDVINGYILAMLKGKNGENYLLGGENLTYQQFFDLVKKTTGKSFKLFYLPYWAMILVGLYNE